MFGYVVYPVTESEQREDERPVCRGFGGLVRDGRAEPEADSVQVHKRKEERPGCIWLG